MVRASHRRGDLVLALLASIGAACLVGLSQPSLPAVLIVAIALVTLSPIVIRAATGRFDPFEPIMVFSIVWSSMFVLKPIVMLDRNEFSFAYYSPAIDLHDSFVEMLVLALLGATSLVIGYFLPAGRYLARRVPSAPDSVNTSILTLLALGAAGLGVALFSVSCSPRGLPIDVLLGGQSTALLDAAQRTGKYFVLAPLALVGSSLVVYAVGLDRRNPNLIGLGFGLVALSWFIWNIFGSRLVLIPLIGGMVVITYLTRGTRPSGRAVLGLMVLVTFIASAVGMSREASERRQHGLAGAAAEIVTHPVRMTDPLVGFQNGMAPGLAAAMQVVPADRPYTYGVSLAGDLFTRPIPRALWPGKPENPREEVTDLLAPQQHSLYRNPEFSCLLGFYVDFGMFGGLFLVLYGVAFRALYEWFRLHERSVAARLIFAVSLPLILPALRDTPVDAFGRWAIIMAPVLAAFALSSGSVMRGFLRLRLAGRRP